MKECKRLKCPKNKGLQGFVRVRKRAKALPDNEKFGQINPVFMRARAYVGFQSTTNIQRICE